jgi:hypothetical protein
MRKFEDLKNKRVHFLDERFYEVGDNVFYPSVTTILGEYPKGTPFETWLKDVGHGAKAIADRAAESGTKVHDAAEKLMHGEEILWDDKHYDFNEWNGVLRFVDFATRFNPQAEAVEVTTISRKHKYAGTLDLVCVIDDTRWLLDIKFGNALYDTYYFQLAAYKQSWEETNPDHPIDRMGILHLKAATRTAGKGKTMQGKGWKVEEPKDSYDILLDQFNHALGIYYYKNPDPRPKNLILPSRVKL